MPTRWLAGKIRLYPVAAWAGTVLLAFVVLTAPARADPAFRAFLDSLWPEAQALGVSRATFDAATGPLTPDLNLPDLAIGGRTTGGGQAEFVQTPAEYLSERVLQNLAGRGRKLLAEHRATLAETERRFGVPGRWCSPSGAAKPPSATPGSRTTSCARSPRRLISAAARSAFAPSSWPPSRWRRRATSPQRGGKAPGRGPWARPVPALRLRAPRGRRGRGRAGRHLGLRPGRARLGGKPASGQGLEARPLLGGRGPAAPRR
jgi:hypothetical protein